VIDAFELSLVRLNQIANDENSVNRLRFMSFEIIEFCYLRVQYFRMQTDRAPPILMRVSEGKILYLLKLLSQECECSQAGCVCIHKGCECSQKGVPLSEP
jgi:hypothetical protein